jgi:hypothetical protein
MRTALITVMAAAALLTGCGGTSAGTPGAPSPSAAATPGSQPQPAVTVKCRLLTCSRGHLGQPCSIAGYPGVIVQVSDTALGCDPSPGKFSSSAPSAPPSSSAASPVTADCQMGWVNIPAGSGEPVSVKKFRLARPHVDRAFGYSLGDYEAMRITISASQTVTVGALTIVWYSRPGAEISSGTADIGQVITAGQSLAFVYDESMGSSPNPPPGAATCSVISYS